MLSFTLLTACAHRAEPRHEGAPSSTAASGPVAYSGTAHVSGTLATFAAPAALTDPIAAPFTITVAEPGRGGFHIAGAIVDGHPDTIVWSGGRPLPVTGACRLDVGEAPIDIATGVARFALDGGVRALTPGDCAFGSSVAVGSGGLATPEPSVRFRLVKDTPFEPSGNAAVAVNPVGHFEGRHGSAAVTGNFTVTTPRRDSWRATKVTMASGTWVVDVTRTAANALVVEAQFDGGLTIQTT
jgi:hypothetical protein